ncbi:MAG TPA: 50S ribosomal protein L25 [Marinilabiliales bacterium]|jgi:large subunit ribosomal protein L25|nr:MAG: 50S ribosomal protein L25/general stress protein Ctc [Bacteroidetes bacterium GWA2_40_14]OFX61903.1 MAG: 50S ribosomal protein L25/general stress protein Ctc [Bacteroidetes bacterium GWC2_40_13]OFX74050.1 MAG: 50S ribosomal protein L25/general stress protein Ctc [Bacteroidetes bacterium GWD2_40_43]OFX93115.1 MAG: 50S ribosomal protein L25/general stress protein Ctc [Bacteroidetes bacterium GWE2_40_63]OFY21485.1 MAG: 50S ribosomal protein L25/general stress protein Ctc [Bacteroidetes bac
MKTFEIKGQKRSDVGKKSAKELRAQALVPCVMYGGKENVHFSVVEKDFKHLIYSPHVYVVNLDVEGVKSQALMQTIQFHPVTDAIEHVDFLEISADKKVTVELPIQLLGSSEGVKQGGKLMLKLRKLRVKGLIKDFPDTLDVDITELQLGKSTKVGDLTYKGLELLDAKNAVVATVRLTRSAMSAKQGEGGK